MEEYTGKNFKNKSNNCLACRSNSIEKVATIKSNQYFWYDYNKYFVYECQICGLLFINPMPTNAFLDAHYNFAFDHDTLIPPQRTKGMDYVIKLILSMLDKEKKQNTVNFYEIGIGTGDFINRITQAGVNARGNDLSEGMTGKKIQFPVDRGRFESLGYDNCFDAVYTCHVFEHSNDPLGFIGAIYKSLKCGGIAVIRVPNRYSSYHLLADKILGSYKWVTLLPVPDHLIMFDKNNLKMLLENNGFRVEKILTLPTMADQTVLILTYLTVLAWFAILRIMPIIGVNIQPSSLFTNRNGKPTTIRKTFNSLMKLLGRIDKIWIMLMWPIFNRLDIGEELFVIARK